MPTKITDQTFSEATADGLTLVDFWAPWCGPCKMLGPVLEEIDDELDGQVKIAKLNIDENPEITQQFGVMSIPTMILFKDGEAVEKIVGYQPKPVIQEYLEKKIKEG